LPRAPHLKIHCLYGVGIPTERGFRYAFQQVRWTWADGKLDVWSSWQSIGAIIAELSSLKSQNRPVKVEVMGVVQAWGSASAASVALREIESSGNADAWMRINFTFDGPGEQGIWANGLDGLYKNGVASSDGDGTVPLASLGYMCTHGWRDIQALNPSRIPVWTKEFEHKPSSSIADIRGGPGSAQHCNLIGNSEAIDDILHIVTGDSSHLRRDILKSNISVLGPMITRRLTSK